MMNLFSAHDKQLSIDCWGSRALNIHFTPSTLANALQIRGPVSGVPLIIFCLQKYCEQMIKYLRQSQ